MAGSGQLTNDELLNLINQTSSVPSTNLPDVRPTQTIEADYNKNIPNDLSAHSNMSASVEIVIDSEKRTNMNLNTLSSATNSDIKETGVIIKEEVKDIAYCNKCNGEGVVKKKPNKDMNAPSDFNIDVDLVSILSKEEITNLIHEYRTELEDTKNKLIRSDRQLAKANDYNTTLRNMVEQLSSEIHRLKHMKTCDIHVQVDKDDFLNYTTGSMTMPSWQADDNDNIMEMDTGEAVEDNASAVCNPVNMTEGLSIADSIKQAAETVVQQQQYNHLTDSGYVYDDQSGLYYHPASGYYYDQNKSLFYDPNTGIYYYYDYDNGTYEFHSQVELQQSSQLNVQEVTSAQNATEKVRHKSSRRKEKQERPRKTPEKKTFKNRRERRQAVAEGSSKHRRSSSTDRQRSRDRKSKRKKRTKCSDSESGCSLSRSPAQSQSSGSRSKRFGEERRVKRSNSEEKCGNDEPRREASTGRNDKEVIDISDEDGMNSIECFRKILKFKSRKAAGYQRSLSEENVCTHRKSRTDVNTCHSDTDGRNVRAQSESRLAIDVSSGNSEDDEMSESGPIIIDSGEKENASKEMLSAGKKIKKSSSDETSSKRRKSSHKRKKKHKKKHHKHQKRSKKHKHKSSELSDTESGELSDSDIEEDKDLLSETNSSDYHYVSDTGEVMCPVAAEPEFQENASNWPPCIRIMVTESDCVQVGTFFMITCTGGKIGRENCDVLLPDLNISKTHAEISYRTDFGQYVLIDLASQNGTFLNLLRLSPAKIASEPYVVSHGDIIQVGSSVLLCHIHSGTDTCDQCEPGVVLASLKSQQAQEEIKVLTKEEKLRQQKLELKQIKKKYGLRNSAYEDNKEVFNNPNYSDKAEERRKTVGSDNPGQKHETPASVHRPISSGNVGHKLLQKMGWKEGESLGKNNTGLQEPISVNVRVNQTAGLGSSIAGNFSADNVNMVDMKKASRRIQAQQRYKQIDSGNPQTSNTASSKQWKKGDTEFT